MSNDNPRTTSGPGSQNRGDLDRDETGNPTREDASGHEEGCGCSGESKPTGSAAGQAPRTTSSNQQENVNARVDDDGNDRDPSDAPRPPGNNRPGNQQGDRRNQGQPQQKQADERKAQEI